jgi:hypothetical protein
MGWAGRRTERTVRAHVTAFARAHVAYLYPDDCDGAVARGRSTRHAMRAQTAGEAARKHMRLGRSNSTLTKSSTVVLGLRCPACRSRRTCPGAKGPLSSRAVQTCPTVVRPRTNPCTPPRHTSYFTTTSASAAVRLAASILTCTSAACEGG